MGIRPGTDPVRPRRQDAVSTKRRWIIEIDRPGLPGVTRHTVAKYDKAVSRVRELRVSGAPGMTGATVALYEQTTTETPIVVEDPTP